MNHRSYLISSLIRNVIIAIMLSPTLASAVCTTGFNNPSANAADTGGDNNGYQTNPINAHIVNESPKALFAVDTNSGNQTGTACTSPGKDRHRFYNYGFNLPSGSAIQGIEVQLNAKVDSVTGSPKICAELSWDGGTTWTSGATGFLFTSTLSKSNAPYILGGPGNTWGRNWASADFSNNNFRVRLTNVASDNNRDFSLDYVGVKVTCTSPPTVGFTSDKSYGIERGISDNIAISDISVSLSTISSQTVQVNWSVAPNGAKPASYGTDYQVISPSVTASGILSFAPGETRKTIRIATLPDYGLVEGDETAMLTLSGPSNASLGTYQNIFTIYDAPKRGFPGDFWADVVLGQRDYAEATTNKVVPNRVFNPGGVVVDRGSAARSTGQYGRAYVWDSGNSRILGFNLDNCYGQACNPAVVNGVTLVFGQPTGTDYGACNRDASLSRWLPTEIGQPTIAFLAPASASTLCGIPAWYVSPKEKPRSVGMAVDKVTGDLYVPDYENNRVLVFKDPFTDSTPTIADDVIGQDDFSGVYCNKTENARTGNGDGNINTIPAPSDSSLCSMSDLRSNGFGVALDADGNLWVADGGNNRVLRFLKDTNTGKIQKTATLKLEKFYVNGSTTLDSMKGPSSLAFGQGGKLYIADAGNNADSLAKRRVLVLTPQTLPLPPFQNNMAASTFKDITNNSSDDIHLSFISTLDDPTLASQSGLWISGYFAGSGTREVRQYSWSGNVLRTLKLAEGSQNFEGPVDVDKTGKVLVPGGRDINDVLVYKTSSDTVPDSLLPPRHFFNATTENRLSTPLGIATANNQLFLADGHRILIWNNLDQLTNGQPADSIIGQKDYNSADYIFNDDRFYSQLKVDGNDRLWVAARDRIFVYDTPLFTWSKPYRVIQGPLPVLFSTETIPSLSPNTREIGIAPMVVDNKEFLWVAQPFIHRVLRIRNPLNDPLGPNPPTVDMVLGQENLSGYCCNRVPLGVDSSGATACATHSGITNYDSNIAPPIKGRDYDRLCYPYNLSIDRNNDLYLSDHMTEGAGNLRLLRFNTADTSKFPTNNTSVIFGPLVGPNMQANKEFTQATFETAFNTPVAVTDDPTHRMVSGFDSYNGHSVFVGAYNNPNQISAPTAYLNDHTLRAAAITFDRLGNLYVADTNHAKVFVYKQPFISIAGNQTPVRPAMTMETSQISALSDAAYTCGTPPNTTTTTNSSTIFLGKCLDHVSPSIAGLRFTNIDIPPTATIVNAVIIFMPIGISPFTAPLKVKITGVGQPSPNPLIFSGDLNLLPRISDSSTGQPIPPIPLNDSDNGPWRKDHWHATPNLKNIVQEIIDQNGWARNNSMAFLFSDDGTFAIREMFGKYPVNPLNPLDRDFSPILYIQYY